MSGIGWPSHDEDEKSRIARCYTEADQPTGCPLCILRAVPARLFSIVCDTCGLETVAQKMPVEAEVRAAAGVRRRVARAAAAEKERDEARERERLAKMVAEQAQERAASLSRELLAAIQARDREREARRAAEEATASHAEAALRCVKAEAEAERLRWALREIANEGCAQVRYERDGTGTRTYWCPDRWPHHDGGAKWCWGCIARAALAAEEGK